MPVVASLGLASHTAARTSPFIIGPHLGTVQAGARALGLGGRAWGVRADLRETEGEPRFCLSGAQWGMAHRDGTSVLGSWPRAGVDPTPHKGPQANKLRGLSTSDRRPDGAAQAHRL
jgi:hypothetical protein